MTTVAPALFNTQDAFQGPYPARIQEFTEAGRKAGLPAAQQDREKIALVLVDYQRDFVDPTGALYVPGSQEDVGRLLTWFYTHAHSISSVYASLDTHLPLQIFYSSWWIDPKTGEHPAPFTVITVEDVTSMRWVPVFPDQGDWSVSYVHTLSRQAKKELMIWPFHTMEGTLGHMLFAPISEAIAWHSAARQAQPIYVVKGKTVRTENYGIFGAEVGDPEDPQSSLNVPLLAAVMEHKKVYIAGEAKSHCVIETARQLVSQYADQPELLARLYVLLDCTSSVVHPGIDFEAMANDELAGMQKMGINLARSTDAIV